MQLLSHPFSPYGRKVTLATALKGLQDRIEVTQVDTNPLDNREITAANPLGKIPALIIEGALFRVVRGLADHCTRHGFAKLTGAWPCEERPEPQ